MASGWEKVIVEKKVQDSSRRIWQYAGQHSFAELNGWLESRCKALWLEIPCPDASGLTLQEALEIEQPYLMPMPVFLTAIMRWWHACPVPAW